MGAVLPVASRALHAVSKSTIWFQAFPQPDLARYPSGTHFAVTIPTAVALSRGESHPLYLRSTISYRYVDDVRYNGERKMSTLAYNHVISDAEDSGNWFRWEWHPYNSAVETPHLHVHTDASWDVPAWSASTCRQVKIHSSR